MIIMIRLTLFTVLLSLASVDSGNNNNNNNSPPLTVSVRNVPHGFHVARNNSISSNSKRTNVPVAPQPQSVIAEVVAKEKEAQTAGRDKRASSRGSRGSRDSTPSGDFQLDQSELARQNQITQQIFANYLERRLFPNRSVSQKIPTIADILPKPKPSGRPRPRGFSASSDGFKKSGGGSIRNRLAAASAKRQTSSSKRQQVQYEEEEEDLNLAEDQQSQANENPQDEFDDDVQESLQSVESEQHDQYYGDIFHRDPSENEIDSDCPNCVDESQYMPNKWTMPLLKLGEKRYYLGIFFKANWFKATQYCRYHGMHLASISSQEENDRLEKHIRDFGLGHEHFWISGTDLADEGNYFWMATGRPITFTNWNAGEPNNFRYENGEEENCLELWNRDGKGLKWNDSPCSFETYFVCEVQPV
ncbi:nucleomorphin isoform X1 [Drosophila innubila]|uniref:nucleomorphin isoform X1 n=1 Tax=Drosophila innubila TaxID=198719 RepID=UPI00148C0A47|nr:nucleomorphin isoform X1 [Drosophila innubila]